MPGVDPITITVGDDHHRIQEVDITTLPGQSSMDGGRVYASVAGAGTTFKLYSDFGRSTVIASSGTLSTSTSSRVTLTAVGGSGLAGTFYWHPQSHTEDEADIELWLLPIEDADLTQIESQITQLYVNSESSFSSVLREVMRDLVMNLYSHHEALFVETENGQWECARLQNPEAYRRWAQFKALEHIYRHHNSVSREDFYLARAEYYAELAARAWASVRPRVDDGGDRKADARLLTQMEVLPG